MNILLIEDFFVQKRPTKKVGQSYHVMIFSLPE